MSPIKFEENIKKELENRTISVSPDSWDKLSNRLEGSQKPKKKYYWWSAIAAIIVISLWVGMDFMDAQIEIEPSVVIEPEVKEIIPVENILKGSKETEVLIVQEKVEPVETKDIKEENTQLEIIKTENYPQIVNVISKPVEVVEVSTIEEQKVQEIVAYIIESNEKNELVSDAEIDVLMLQAQREIQLQKLLNDTSNSLNANTVNADLLLYEVESEIDKSFRDKVFKELKIQFKSIKNAVAQRNN